MQSALGFGWIAWRRCRIALVAAVASIVLTWIIRQTEWADYAMALGGSYFAFSVVALMHTLSFADGSDLVATSGSYPRHLLLLPVRNLWLALWPALFGAVAVGAVWTAFAGVALYAKFGFPVLVLPALGAVALLLTIQAIGWTPFPVAFLRTVLMVVVGGALAVAGPVAQLRGIEPVWIGAGYLAFILAAFPFAVRGIARSRSGQERTWSLPQASRTGIERASRPFRSAMEAQVWLENRRDGQILPSIALFLALLFLIPAFADKGAPVTLGPVTIGGTYLCFLVPFLLLPFLSGFDGCCTSLKDNFRSDYSLVLLLASRPLSDASLVESKLRMAFWATLRAWAVLSPGLVFLAMAPVNGGTDRLGPFLWSAFGLRGVVLALLVIGAAMALTWRATVAAMWLRLAHEPWLRNGVGIGLPLVAVAATFYVAGNASNNPDLLALVGAWAGRVLILLVVVKVALAFVVARRLWERGLVSLGAMRKWFMACLATGSGVFLTFGGLAAWPVPAWQMAAGIFLMLPLVRVPAAVLTLHANRHR